MQWVGFRVQDLGSGGGAALVMGVVLPVWACSGVGVYSKADTSMLNPWVHFGVVVYRFFRVRCF